MDKRKLLISTAVGILLVSLAAFAYFWFGVQRKTTNTNPSQKQNSADNSNGAKDSSGEAATVSIPVKEVSAVSGPGQITLSWIVPTGETKAVNYEIKYSTTSDFSDAAVTTSADLTKTITGLESGKTYYVIVRAIDESGNQGDWSQPVAVIPAAVHTYDLSSAVNVTGGGADYIWRLFGTDISPVDHIEVQWSTAPGLSPLAGAVNVNVNGSSGSYAIPNISGGVTYYLRSRVIEKSGAQAAWSATNIFSVVGTVHIASQDKTTPSQVTGLVATPGDGIVYLRWNFATDNVGVTGYEYGFSDVPYEQPSENSLVDVTGILGNSVNRTGLINGLSYSFWVRAYDAAGNRGPWSLSQTTTPFRVIDTQKPSQVTGVVATAGNGLVTISGYTATDNVGIDHYALWWSTTNTTPTGSPNVTSIKTSTYQVSNLTNNAAYYFWMAAADAAGNFSITKSLAVSATPTGAYSDTTPPSQVTGLTVTPGNATVTLSGYSATDNTGVASYQVYYYDSRYYSDVFSPTDATTPSISSLTSSALKIISLPNDVTYYYWMRAVDAAGNKGPWSEMVPGTPLSTIDGTNPSTVAGIVATPGDGKVTLSGYTATDNVGVASYSVYYNTTGTVSAPPQITGVTTPTIDITGLQDGTTYYFWMKAVDAAGNKSSSLGASVNATPYFIDLEAPNQVIGLSAIPGDTNIDLSWNAAADNLAVTGYDVEYSSSTDFSNAMFAASPSASITVANLTNGTPYYFKVRAYDAANNKGDWSNVITSTPIYVDNISPSQVTGLVITPGNATVFLSGYSATDNVGIASYQVYYYDSRYYNDTYAPVGTTAPQITDLTSSTLKISPLPNDVTYYYWMRAIDAAGNKGPWSEMVPGTPLSTLDGASPSTVTGVVATPGNGKVTLSGYTATDNVGVDHYVIWYNTTGTTPAGSPNINSVTASTYDVTGLTNNVQYYFWMSATDAAGNKSVAKSVVATATPVPAGDTESPSQVSGVSIAAGDTKATLSGYTATDNVGVDHYAIWYNTTGSEPTGAANIDNVTTATTDVTGLVNGTTYYFWLKAVDAAGNQSALNSSVVSTQPVAPGISVQTLAFSTTPNTIINSTSADGLSWNGQGSTVFKTNGTDAVWDGTAWWATGYNTGDLAYHALVTSTDGINWTTVSEPMSSGNITGITYGVANGIPTYVAVGSSPGGNLMYKQGSGNWTMSDSGLSMFSTIGNRVAWNGSIFVAVGRGNNNVAWSSDGITWNGLGSTLFGATSNGNDIAWNGTYWLAVGNGATNVAAWSLNGIDWTPISLAGIFTTGSGVTWSDSLNAWVIVGTGTYTIAFTQDLHKDPVNYPLTFTPVANSKTAIFSSIGKDVTWDGSRFVAVGVGTNGMAISPDGLNWTGLGLTTVASGRGVVSNKQPYTGSYWNTPVGVKAAETTAKNNTKTIYLYLAAVVDLLLAAYLIFRIYRRRNR